MALSAEGTSDPDGNTVSARWYVYPEAILDAKDDGNPPLSAYRRAIIDVGP